MHQVYGKHPEQRLAILIVLPVLLATQACATPERIPLGAPFPLVRGGTPVPADGMGATLELTDGLQGQELLRKELLAASVNIGIGELLAVSVGGYGGHEDSSEPGGFLASAKVRIGSWLGERTSTAVRVGYSHIARDLGSQDESLMTLDLAIPTELLFGEPEQSVRFSGYAGPRLLYENYQDKTVPGDDFTGVVPGLLAGLHFDFGRVHVFGEGTLAWRPETSFRGTEYSGGAILLPSIGVMVHTGRAFRWD